MTANANCTECDWRGDSENGNCPECNAPVDVPSTNKEIVWDALASCRPEDSQKNWFLDHLEACNTHPHLIVGFAPFDSSEIVDRAPDFRGVALPAELVEAARRAGASDRSRQREAAAMWAAITAARYVLGVEVSSAEPTFSGLGSRFCCELPRVLGLSWVLLTLERWGTGGTGGIGGNGDRASARAHCFSRLGKGRAAASDGPAWSSAVEDAARWCLDHLGGDLPRLLVSEAGDVGLGNRTPISLERLAEVLGQPFTRALAVRFALSSVNASAPCGASHPWAGDGYGPSICGNLEGMALAASRLWELGGGQ